MCKVDFFCILCYNKDVANKKGGKCMKIHKKELLNRLRNIVLVIIGTLILAFGTAIFILPFDLVAGGMSGLAIVIDALIPIEAITVDVIITVLTWGLFLLGLIFLGKDFAMKTLISAIVYPIGISLFLQLSNAEVLGGLLSLGTSGYSELPLIISATVGGSLVGVGCAVTFLSGGSTGGMDIIAFLICKLFKKIKSSTAIFLIDASIVILGVFLKQDLILSLLGVISAMISAIVIDKIFLGGTAALVAQIVTEEGDAINRAVIEQMDRTTTILSVKGGYSDKEKKMLMVSFSMRQYTHLMEIVLRIDPAAFVTVSKAHEISGEGWTR